MRFSCNRGASARNITQHAAPLHDQPPHLRLRHFLRHASLLDLLFELGAHLLQVEVLRLLVQLGGVGHALVGLVGAGIKLLDGGHVGPCAIADRSRASQSESKESTGPWDCQAQNEHFATINPRRTCL